MFFMENPQYQNPLRQQLIIAQEFELPQDNSQTDPLVNNGAEHLIDFGVILIAVTIVLIIGMLNKQMEKAIH